MIEVTDPAGGKHAIDPAAIAELYPSITGHTGLTTILFSGGMQEVQETAQTIILMIADAAHFISLSVPDAGPSKPSFPIWVNVRMVPSVRPSPSVRTGSEVCVAGTWVSVREPYAFVMAALAHAKSLSPQGATLSFVMPTTLSHSAPHAQGKRSRPAKAPAVR